MLPKAASQVNSLQTNKHKQHSVCRHKQHNIFIMIKHSVWINMRHWGIFNGPCGNFIMTDSSQSLSQPHQNIINALLADDVKCWWWRWRRRFHRFAILSVVPFRSRCRVQTWPRLGAEFLDCELVLERWRLAASDLRSAEHLCLPHSSRIPRRTITESSRSSFSLRGER